MSSAERPTLARLGARTMLRRRDRDRTTVVSRTRRLLRRRFACTVVDSRIRRLLGRRRDWTTVVSRIRRLPRRRDSVTFLVDLALPPLRVRQPFLAALLWPALSPCHACTLRRLVVRRWVVCLVVRLAVRRGWRFFAIT